MKTYRSYNKLVNEIINLKIPFRVEIIGYITYNEIVYPMIAIRHIQKTAVKNLVISAGAHGDEYFGVHILLKWIQQHKSYSCFNYHIVPVINAFGYQHNSRDNGARQDVNNANSYVKNSKVKELAILYDNFPLNVDLSIDIHGDTGKSKCYAYERKIDTFPSLAEIALQEVNSILPYEKSKTIYKMKVNKGVIRTPKDDEGIEAVMEKSAAEATITIELPGKCNSQKRTEGGIAILNSILHHYSELK